jgi:hypothetical protein
LAKRSKLWAVQAAVGAADGEQAINFVPKLRVIAKLVLSGGAGETELISPTGQDGFGVGVVFDGVFGPFVDERGHGVEGALEARPREHLSGGLVAVFNGGDDGAIDGLVDHLTDQQLVGEYREGRIDPRGDGVGSQQARAEAVDRRDPGLGEFVDPGAELLPLRIRRTVG